VGVRFGGSARKSADRLHEIEAKIGSLTIKVICPQCKATLVVKKKHEGSQARCPKCRAPIDVREPEVLPELEAEKQAAQEHRAAAEAAVGTSYTSLSRPFVHFIRSTIRTRTHLGVIQHFTKGDRAQVAGTRELSMLLGVGERDIHEILRELVTRGVLKEIGVKTFNYDPVPAVRRHLAELATCLAAPEKRSEILAVILESEKKKKRKRR
jgi:DNA-directed RNA polymerase subunit M/transcription elongation factor TFIIS